MKYLTFYIVTKVGAKMKYLTFYIVTSLMVLCSAKIGNYYNGVLLV